MSIKLNDKYVSTFIRSREYDYIQPQITAADKMLREKNGPGSDFLGWVHLPEEYDKEEFARIQRLHKRFKAAVTF